MSIFLFIPQPTMLTQLLINADSALFRVVCVHETCVVSNSLETCVRGAYFCSMSAKVYLHGGILHDSCHATCKLPKDACFVTQINCIQQVPSSRYILNDCMTQASCKNVSPCKPTLKTNILYYTEHTPVIIGFMIVLCHCLCEMG